jgi:aryl-alcohol dehydrogenase-like predicted oxidoreductase
VVDAIQKVAEVRGVAMAQVALAWVLSKPVVSCPIVGATKPNHLQDAVSALALNLTDDEIADLETRYQRRTTIGGERRHVAWCGAGHS